MNRKATKEQAQSVLHDENEHVRAEAKRKLLKK
jgi:hypothetical protein